jgi:hypothetical protein
MDGRSGPAVRVANTLSLWMDGVGACYASLPMIAAHGRMSQSSVKVGLAELKDAGLLEWRKGGGRGRANQYQAHLPKGADEKPVSARLVSVRQTTGQTPSETSRGKDQTGQRAAPKKRRSRSSSSRSSAADGRMAAPAPPSPPPPFRSTSDAHCLYDPLAVSCGHHKCPTGPIRDHAQGV